MLKLKKSLKKEITEILDQGKIYSTSQLFLLDQLCFTLMEQSFTVDSNNSWENNIKLEDIVK